MDDDCCEILRCCCECGLCLGLCCLCCKDNSSSQPQPHPYAPRVKVGLFVLSPEIDGQSEAEAYNWAKHKKTFYSE